VSAEADGNADAGVAADAQQAKPVMARAAAEPPAKLAASDAKLQQQDSSSLPISATAARAQSSVFAEAELPERFEIPMLAGAPKAEGSLAERVRAARDNPETLLPHRREVELNPSSPYSRVMRELRRVLGLRGEARPLIVTIVSELRDCGKSTLAANLARAFADAGSRVLILDADRRSAALTQAVGTEAPEGRVRLGEAMRPVFALDGSWRSGVFLSSLALGRSDHAGPGRRATTSMPSFASVRSLADVLIIDTQTGTRGPALGPDLPAGATLILAPQDRGEQPSGASAFASVELAMGQGNFSDGTAGRRRARAGG
jgi:Mrp family chromosome partitioning ATPase